MSSLLSKYLYTEEIVTLTARPIYNRGVILQFTIPHFHHPFSSNHTHPSVHTNRRDYHK